jgi:hypothetical protein
MSPSFLPPATAGLEAATSLSGTAAGLEAPENSLRSASAPSRSLAPVVAFFSAPLSLAVVALGLASSAFDALVDPWSSSLSSSSSLSLRGSKSASFTISSVSSSSSSSSSSNSSFSSRQIYLCRIMVPQSSLPVVVSETEEDERN